MPPQSTLGTIPDGYPKLSAFISKDKEYAIFRKFRQLNTRNLLYLQSELTYLESELEQLDSSLASENPDSLKSWPTFRADGKRMKLIVKIRKTSCAYNDALLQYEQVNSLGSPSKAQIQGFKAWMEDTTPIIDASDNFLEHRLPAGDMAGYLGRTTEAELDLVSFKRDPDSWLSGFFRDSSFLKYFYLEDLIWLKKRPDGQQTAIVFFPSSRVEKIVTVSAVLLSVCLTVSAIAVLQVVKTDGIRIALVGVFSLLVAASLAMSGARKSEVTIGTIGYAAVLVVFVSNQK